MASTYFAPCIWARRRRCRRCNLGRGHRIIASTTTPGRCRDQRRNRVRQRSRIWRLPSDYLHSGAQITQQVPAGESHRSGNFEPTFKVIGCEYWSDDPQFVGAVKNVRHWHCGSGIIEVMVNASGLMAADGTVLDSRPLTRRIIEDDRTFSFVLYEGFEADGEHTIVVTQNDVRAIQLAKAALRAGIDLLLGTR